LLAALENLFPPVPADTVVAFGAVLAGMGRIQAWVVFLLTWVANVSSAVGVYFAARRLGRPFLNGPMGRRLIQPGAWERLQSLTQAHGTWGVFASRFIPAVRAVVPPFAGVVGLSVPRTVIPLAAASALWYGAITYLAFTFVKQFDQIAVLVRSINRLAWIAGFLLVIVLLGAWLVRRHRRRRVLDQP
jgi:membrane protein DedA with SNARE-associated domain